MLPPSYTVDDWGFVLLVASWEDKENCTDDIANRAPAGSPAIARHTVFTPA